MPGRSPRRFLIWAGALLLVPVLASYLYMNSPQMRNLRSTGKWIARPAVVELREHLERELGSPVSFYTQTRHQGVVGVHLKMSLTDEQRNALLARIWVLNPPRPVEILEVAKGSTSSRVQLYHAP